MSETIKTDVISGIDASLVPTFDYKYMSLMPSQFRMAVYPNGKKVLQVGFAWNTLSNAGIEWQDVKQVYVNADGDEMGGGQE